MAIEVDFAKLVKTLYADESQRNLLTQLALFRLKLEDKELNATEQKLVDDTVLRYIKNGIHFIPPNTKHSELGAEEIEYLAEESGTDLKGWGYNQKTEYILTNGFIIPIRDSKNRIIFYINYSYERDKSQKYINVYTGNYGEKEKGIKLYGLHNTAVAYQQKKMIVLEGVFDCNLLAEFDIPTCAILGTQLTPFQKSFLKRFDDLIYISDNDVEGESAFNKFRKEFPNTRRFFTPTKYKDPEEFYVDTQGNILFQNWIESLKKF